MKKTRRQTIKRTYLTVISLAAATAITAVHATEPANKAGSAASTAAELKAIAEEGFIYGLPIVMNYAVMYEYSVDKNSGQYKAPFNQINNEARVFTYKIGRAHV